MDKYSLYLSLMDAYSKAYPTKTKKQHQCDVNKIWTEIKKEKNCSELVSKKILEYKEKSLQSKSNLFSMWKSFSPISSSSSTTNINVNVNDKNPTVEVKNLSNSFEELELSQSDSQPIQTADLHQTKTKVPAPAQEKLQIEVDCINAEIVALTKRKDSGLFTDEMRADLKKKRTKLSALQNSLITKKREMIRKRRNRRQLKEKLAKICEKNPEFKKDLKVSYQFVQESIECFVLLNIDKQDNSLWCLRCLWSQGKYIKFPD